MLPIGQDDEFVKYLIANFESETLNPVQLLTMKNRRYDNFDELKENHKKLLTVNFCNHKKRWILESTCDCRDFQRNFICKHLLGLAFYNKLKKCPQEGNAKPIAKKNSKGRIALAKKALQKQ